MKSISINFNSLEILAIFEDDVFMRGSVMYDENKDSNEDLCVIRVKKPLFNKTWKEYLKEKQRCCMAYKEACGAANVVAEDVKEEGIWHILNEDYPFDEENPNNIPMYVNVKSYTTKEISVEVEHG
jgi:hypothetical protein